MDNSEIYSIVQLGIIGGAVGLAIISAAISGPFIARYWYQAQRAEMELGLKQSMVERGMNAQQICAVIEANGDRKASPARPPVTANEWKEWAQDLKGWAHRWRARRMKV